MPPAHVAAQRRGPLSILSLSDFDIAYCCVVMVLCYALRGSTGFGAAAAMPLLGLVIPLKVLIPAWTLVGIAASITLFGRDRHHVAWMHILRLAPACLAGVLIGLYLFSSLELRALAMGLGILVLIYGGYSLWATYRPMPRWNVPARGAAPAAGLIGGMIGTAFGTMASLFFAVYLDAIQLAQGALPRHHERDPAGAGIGARRGLLGGRRIHLGGARDSRRRDCR